MKLSVLFITSVLTLVAATPIVVPRAPSNPFKLVATGNFNSRSVPALQVRALTTPGYYSFGWFTPAEFEPELYFPDEWSYPGGVHETDQNEYEMVLVPLSSPDFPDVYQVLLADVDSTGIEPTRHFFISGGEFKYDDEVEPFRYWVMCETTTDEAMELFFVPSIPEFCVGPKAVTLHPSGEGWRR